MNKFIKAESGEVINSRYIKFFKVLDRIDYQNFKDGNYKRFGVVAYIDGEGTQFVYSSDSEEDCVNFLTSFCNAEENPDANHLVGGKRYTLAELAEASNYYEAFCTAEYMQENYEQVKGILFEEILLIASEVREKMDDWGECSGDAEDRAITEVLEERGLM